MNMKTSLADWIIVFIGLVSLGLGFASIFVDIPREALNMGWRLTGGFATGVALARVIFRNW